MERQLLNATEASRMVGVSVPVFHRLAESNGIAPVTAQGSRTRWFRRVEVERLVLGGQVEENSSC